MQTKSLPNLLITCAFHFLNFIIYIQVYVSTYTYYISDGSLHLLYLMMPWYLTYVINSRNDHLSKFQNMSIYGGDLFVNRFVSFFGGGGGELFILRVRDAGEEPRGN